MQHADKQSLPIEPAIFSELRDLTRRARGGDVSVLPRLRVALAERPELWQHAGDLEKIVVRQWAELLGGGDPLATEALRLKAEDLRVQLEGEAPTPLERLLVGQVVAHWLEMSHAQLRVADGKGATPGQGAFDLKRAESAQRRYLAAMKSLAAVRQLTPRGLLPLNHLRVHEPARKLA